ncbi:MAG: zf-HC2 domain-containing protein [Gemmatimonadales bacterium]
MRHIPEEELHAYLDQALSRSQAVEIESHLAHCVRCRAVRGDIALLRDRTTALLAQLGPGLVVLPPIEAIERRYAIASARRQTLMRRAVWAASIAAAVGLGWGARQWAPVASVPEPEVAVPIAAHPVATPHTELHPRLAIVTPHRSPVQAPRVINDMDMVEYDTLGVDPTVRPAGLWRNVSLAGATAAGTPIPRVAGLPVLQIQLQESPEASPVVSVDQQLSNGTLIRTIEGPAGQVWSIFAATTVPTDTLGQAGAATLSLRQGDRMLLMTARVPQDSLRALAGKLRMK